MEETLEKLIEMIRVYNPDEEHRIRQAYEYADMLHSNQIRESGEPYITHPLNVAVILAELHADGDTLCAALLHDVLEDTTATKKNIEVLFNADVAKLVDGVTKLKKMNFSTKDECNLANTRKIITGVAEDVRIIMIKLADRLHNMRTLHHKKSVLKQKENALETMEIFVPLAYSIGAYRIKNELEDLSLQYLEPDKYKETEAIKHSLEEEAKDMLQEMFYKITTILNAHDIPNEIKIRTKNIYGLYKLLTEGKKITEVHDLFALKIMVQEIDECYIAMRHIHSLYHPINNMFKDYICNPKTNKYQSLHSTVFGPDNRRVHAQIRTFDMDRIASFGIATYWDIYKSDAREEMQAELKVNFQFLTSLIEMNSTFGDNQEFVKRVKNELFADKVYVYTTKGDVIELPKGSTPIDFAYYIHTDIGNMAKEVYVNEEKVLFDYPLRSNDRVRIVTDPTSSGPTYDWLSMARTSRARTRIRDFMRGK